MCSLICQTFENQSESYLKKKETMASYFTVEYKLGQYSSERLGVYNAQVIRRYDDKLMKNNIFFPLNGLLTIHKIKS